MVQSGLFLNSVSSHPDLDHDLVQLKLCVGSAEYFRTKIFGQEEADAAHTLCPHFLIRLDGVVRLRTSFSDIDDCEVYRAPW